MPLINFNTLNNHGTSRLKNTQFQGEVIDNNDPLKLGRIKVRIRDLHSDFKDKDIPWSAPEANMDQHNATDNAKPGVGKQIKVPPVGTKVHMTFRDESMYHPYFSGTVTDKKSAVPAFTDPKKYKHARNYPMVHGHVEQSGTFNATDEHEQTYEYTHSTGTQVKIGGDGSVNVQTSAVGQGKDVDNKDKVVPRAAVNLNINAQGAISIQSKGTITIIATGDATLQTKGNLNLNVGGKCNFNVKSDLGINVGGKCTFAIKGDWATNIGGTHTHSATVDWSRLSGTIAVLTNASGGKNSVDSPGDVEGAKFVSNKAATPPKIEAPKSGSSENYKTNT